MGAVKELLEARGDEVTAVERCGMEGERIFHSLEELPSDAGYYTTLIVRKAR